MEQNKTSYTKLSALVDDEFTVLEAKGYTWKRWNQEAKRFEISEQYAEGFKKTYTIVTDKGLLDLGSGQLSTLLEAVYYQGKADIIGKRFAVKSNMTPEEFNNASKEDKMKIRYFFNVKRESKPAPMPLKKVEDVAMTADEYDEQPEIDFSEIPF
jgi:hypothetical protein